MAAIPPLVRFMRKIRVEGTCWIWTGTVGGTKSKAGYFQASTKSSVHKVRAARWIYQQMVGPIPEGYEIDHVKARGCSGPLCVNPDHLEAVTPDENSRRARIAMCRSGRHDLTNPANVRWDEQGRRRGCAICKKETEQAKDERKRLARLADRSG